MIKFNNGSGACLCDECRVILSYGFDHSNNETYCAECYKKLKGTTMNSILDLEQRILALGTISDDIRAIYEYISEESDMSAEENDKLSTLLLGIEHLYNIKFNQAFEVFEGVVAEHGRLKRQLENIQMRKDVYL